MNFVDVEPTLENYWRAIILFGRNTASYKFALAKSLIDVSLDSKSDLITLDDLALPYAMHLCEHLKHSPKQSTEPPRLYRRVYCLSQAALSDSLRLS